MSDAEIFREVDEDYRQERMIAFWRRYGGAFLGLAIVAAIASAGYNYYVQREMKQKIADTEVFEQLLNDIKPGTEAESIIALSSYAASANPAQATLAQLTEAALKQRMGNVTAAAQVYHQIADGNQASQEIKDLAVVRLGYMALDADKPEAITPRLQAVASSGSPWRFSAREVLALLLVKAGQRQQGATALSQLAQDAGAPSDLAARARALADFYRGN